MIPGRGWSATFKSTHDTATGETRTFWSRLPVVYFDDDGEGWVAPGEGSRLRSVSSYSNFVEYSPDPTPVAICPADAWQVRYTATKHGPGHTSPVEAWVLYNDGSIVGVGVSADGPDLLGDPWTILSTSNAEGYEPVGGWPENAEGCCG